MRKKREGEEEEQKKWELEIVKYGQCVSWLFTYSRIKGIKAQFPKRKQVQTHRQSSSCSLFLIVKLTETHSFRFSTICDQINNLWVIINDHDVVLLKLDSNENLHLHYTAVYLHCQLNFNSMNHAFFCPGTCSLEHFFFFFFVVQSYPRVQEKKKPRN